MKKIKNNKYLYILATLAILSLLFIIFITMNIKESYTSNKLSTEFIPNRIQRGQSSDPIYNLDMAVMYQKDTEYTDNDISHNTFKPGTSGMYERCFNSCLNDPSCNGIVTDFEKGKIDDDSEKHPLNYNCWMKSSMTKKIPSTKSDPRYSTIFPRNYIS
jgi:hypothetical protein